MTSLRITGDQVIADPSASTNSSAGTATVHGGRRIRSKGHWVEITAIDVTGPELAARSGVVWMRVFDGTGPLVAADRPITTNGGEARLCVTRGSRGRRQPPPAP